MPARPPKRLLLLAAACLFLVSPSCSPPADAGGADQKAVLELVSPVAPLGLHYGEQATLLLRYLLRGQPSAGVTLRLSTDGDDGGATLSAAGVVSNGRGEASVGITAGAVETAFHIIVMAPQAADLVIDVAVSRYAFGNLSVRLDATAVAPQTTTVRAALLTGTNCGAQPPTQHLGTVLRSQAAPGLRALLSFPTLLVRPYTVIGRAEADADHLLAYGCLDIPDRLLMAGLFPEVDVPLQPVFASPVGSYGLKSDLVLQLMNSGVWWQLACPAGLGQTLLDALLLAVPAADRSLAMQVATRRGGSDATGCRLAREGGQDTLDQQLHALLLASAAGMTFAAVAGDVVAMQRTLQLASRLSVRGDTNLVGDHTLLAAVLQVGTASSSYPLDDVPVPAAVDLALQQSGGRLMVPLHALTLRLPRLWRRGLKDLILSPRSIMVPPEQLWQSSVSGASKGMLSGCAAVESLLCEGVSAMCSGHLTKPCQDGTAAVTTALTNALADLPPGLDLRLSAAFDVDDPGGTLQARALSRGQVTGTVDVPGGTAPLTGPSAGPRTGP